ncbi:MAG: MFS transporter [Eubacteriales bacterium]|nr:MFS transporter [Eubacteriales bacterium]
MTGITIENSRGKNDKWLALLAVTAAFTYTFLGRYIYSSLMNAVSGEFSLNTAQAGMYMSAFFLGYIITQVPGGILADLVGPKLLLIISTAVGGLSAALMSTIPGFGAGLAFRLISGVAGGFVFSCSSKVISGAFEPGERSVALGILLASPPMGITLASLLGPLLRDAFGWRTTFLAVGLLALIVLALILLFVRNPQRAPAGSADKPSFITGFLEFLKNRSQLFLAAAGFMFMFTTTGFPTWVNKFTENLNYTETQATIIAMSYSLAGIVGSILSGMIAKKLRLSSRSFLLAVLAAMAVLSLALVFRWSAGAFMLIGIVYGFVSYLPASHFASMAIAYARPEHSATAIASHNLFQQTASVIQPMVLGFGIDMTGGYSVLWYAFAIAMAIGFLATKKTKS